MTVLLSLRKLADFIVHATSPAANPGNVREIHEVVLAIRHRGLPFETRFKQLVAERLSEHPSFSKKASGQEGNLCDGFWSLRLRAAFGDALDKDPYLNSIRVFFDPVQAKTECEEGLEVLRWMGVSEELLYRFRLPQTLQRTSIRDRDVLSAVAVLARSGVKGVDTGFRPTRLDGKFFDDRARIISTWDEYREALWRNKQGESDIELSKKFDVDWNRLTPAEKEFIETRIVPHLLEPLKSQYSFQKRTQVDLSIGLDEACRIVEVKTSCGTLDAANEAKILLQVFRHSLTVRSHGLKGIEYVFYAASIPGPLLEEIEKILRDITKTPYRIWQTFNDHRQILAEHGWSQDVPPEEAYRDSKKEAASAILDPVIGELVASEPEAFESSLLPKDEFITSFLSRPVSSALRNSCPEIQTVEEGPGTVEKVRGMNEAFFCEEGRDIVRLAAFLEGQADLRAPGAAALAEEAWLAVEAFMPGDSVRNIRDELQRNYFVLRASHPPVAFLPELQEDGARSSSRLLQGRAIQKFLSRRFLSDEVLSRLQGFWKEARKKENPEDHYFRSLTSFYWERRGDFLAASSVDLASKREASDWDFMSPGKKGNEWENLYGPGGAALDGFQAFFDAWCGGAREGSSGAMIRKEAAETLARVTFLIERGGSVPHVLRWGADRLETLREKYRGKLVDRLMQTADGERLRSLADSYLAASGFPAVSAQNTSFTGMEGHWQRFRTVSNALKALLRSGHDKEIHELIEKKEPSSRLKELDESFLTSLSEWIIRRYVELRLKEPGTFFREQTKTPKKPSDVSLPVFHELHPAVVPYFLALEKSEVKTPAETPYDLMQEEILRRLPRLDLLQRVHGLAQVGTLRVAFRDLLKLGAHWLLLSPDEEWVDLILFYFVKRVARDYEKYNGGTAVDLIPCLAEFPEVRGVAPAVIEAQRELYAQIGVQLPSDTVIRLAYLIGTNDDPELVRKFSQWMKGVSRLRVESRAIDFYLTHVVKADS